MFKFFSQAAPTELIFFSNYFSKDWSLRWSWKPNPVRFTDVQCFIL